MKNLNISLMLSRAEKYPAKQHAQRVAKELGHSDGLIYLLGRYQQPSEDSDQPKTWKQRKYFYYCTGVNVPNCCATYDISSDELVLYIPEIDPKQVVWVGRPPTREEAQSMYDVDDVRHNSTLFDDLKEWKQSNSKTTFYILHKDQIPELDILDNVNSGDLQPAMDRCRVIKDEHEIQCIRRANEISTAGHRSVLRNIRNFVNESQIQGVFEYELTTHQAKPAYGTIAGSGENAAVLHYGTNNEPLKGRQLVCMDAGAECDNYASDVTRSFPISGTFSKEAKEIYSLVELMQESSIQAVKPGVKMLDLHVHCHKVLIEGFLRLGILHNGTLTEILKAGTSKGFLPHGLGHHLGLEVHDVLKIPILHYGEAHHTLAATEAYSLCRPEQPPLEAGMVITIEPGIYFNRTELHRAYLHSPVHSKYINREVLDHYWAVGGVRIEDDILVTRNGYENLTTAPKGSEALELIRGGKDCRDWGSGL